MKNIYKIYSPTEPKSVYIGMCGSRLSVRLCQHRYYYLKALESDGFPGTFYSSFFIFNQDPDAIIELIEQVSDDKGREIEQSYIDKYKAEGYDVVNSNQAYKADGEKQKISAQKSYVKNREKVIERSKLYYYRNRDKILQKMKDERDKKKAQEECLSKTEVVE
jgi:hypothetical protein